MPSAPCIAPLLALAAPLLALGSLLLAPRVEVDAATGAVALEARGEPLGVVLEAIKARAPLSLIVDAALEARPVTVSGRFANARHAARAAALAAGGLAEESGGVLLIRRAARRGAGAGAGPGAGGTAPATVTVSAGPDGLLYAATLGFPVLVLRDAPEDATARARYESFEGRAGIGSISARDIEERAVREVLEARPALRAVLAKAGLALEVRGDIDTRAARVYVEPPSDLMYAEVLYAFRAPEDRRTWIAHLVFVIGARTQACERLVLFRSAAPEPPAHPPAR